MKKRLQTTAVVFFFGAVSVALAGEGHHWTYSGEGGPEHWGELDASYAACSEGEAQSPIDLAGPGVEMVYAAEASYSPLPLTVLNNGHTVQIAAEGAGTLVSGSAKYGLLQVHFHAPSEHVINGEAVPVEAHFVHRSAEGTLGVLGVFVVEGEENPALAALLMHLPETEGPAQTFAETMIDLNALLPEDLSIYRYAGSLTTPPCTEGVAWHVLKDPVTASKAQIDRLSHVLHGNARPIQPLNGRPLIIPSS